MKTAALLFVLSAGLLASQPALASDANNLCLFKTGPKTGRAAHLDKPMAVGQPCDDLVGDKGVVVAPPARASGPAAPSAADNLCLYKTGPKAGSANPLSKPQAVGEACNDLVGDKGTVVAPPH